MSKNRMASALAAALLGVLLVGCMQNLSKPKEVKVPEIPKALERDENGIPVIRVYNLKEEMDTRMDIETYVEGVLAGEMKNDWPEEALKAQAILARTFVMRFLDTKSSKYENADISTDVTEAQAYAEGLVNDRIRKAVQDTKGMVMSYEGEFVNAWFHAHSGGMTELPKAGLEYKENPPYSKSVQSLDSERAPENVKNWKASFTDEEFKAALQEMGVIIRGVSDVKIGESSESGRAVTLVINERSVSAPSLRIHLGPDRMKSTMITSIKKTDGGVEIEGKGYGHGVGLSQWGAYAMAENGKSAEEIVRYYFDDVDIVRLWS